jgi:hypothetical protein
MAFPHDSTELRDQVDQALGELGAVDHRAAGQVWLPQNRGYANGGTEIII